jgi:hypothetical protein
MKAEVEYRNALFDRLRNILPEDATVEKEYRHGGTTSDLYVRSKEGFPISYDTEIFFELKHNLTRKSQLDRLVGQIHGLDPKRHNIIVVLTGERDPALIGRLKDQYADFLEGGAFWGSEPWMALVEIS